jgi:hypothetical protein
VGTAAGASVGLLIIIIALILVLRHASKLRKKPAPKNTDEEPKALLGDEWEIDPDRLTIGRVLGEGQFGQVWREAWE